jgi:protein-S-isoprenylcysteine O-methyltransferase Ste14
MRSLLTPVLTAALICVLFWLWFTQIDGSVWRLHHVIGLAVTASSSLLWARSRFDLGASFTGRAEARTLVTHGMYSRIRHPIYVFGELMTVGLFVFLGHPLWLLLLVVTIPVQVLRARNEESVLETAFGEEYRAHKTRTWF